jgi:O-antigen ligase
MMEAYILNILLGICFFFLAISVYKPFYGLIAYLLIFMCRFGEFYPILAEVRFELIVGIYLVVRTIINAKGIYKAGWEFNKAVRYVWLFLVIIFLSVPFAFDVATAWEWSIYYLKLMIFALLVLCLINSEEDLKKFIWWYVVMTFWVAIVPFINYLEGGSYIAQGVRRINAQSEYFSNPNALANTILQGMPFIFYSIMFEERKHIKFVLVGMLGICGVVVIMTGSRGGFLGLLTFLAVLVYQSRNKGRALAISVILIALLFAYAGSDYEMRYATILEFGGSDLSATSRTTGLLNGISMMIRRPFLGVGIGCYPLARKAWYGWGLWSHNHYGQLFGELGVTGTVVWSLLIYWTFRNLSEVKRIVQEKARERNYLFYLSNAVFGCLIIRLVVGYTVHSLYGFIWYICAALSVLSLDIVRRERFSKEVVKIR